MKKEKNINYRHILKKTTPIAAGLLVLLIFYAFLYKLLMPKINAFGCFDDCFNFMGGYFLLKGKTLYSEIFFNHQLLMAYISYAVQALTTPVNLYELILRHRQLLLVWGLLSTGGLFLRFRWPILGFAFVYELSKFYLFGDRFLAESFIVYPLVYLLGLVFAKRRGQLLVIDYAVAPIAAWFVIFMREPYTLVALFLYVYILFGKVTRKTGVSILFFLFLSCITVLSVPLQDYFFNVVTLNRQFSSEVTLFSLFQGALYPLFVFIGGSWHVFSLVLLGMTSLYLIFLFFLIKRSEWKLVVVVSSLLWLANLRPVAPGVLFYEAFHILVWFALLTASVFFLMWVLVPQGKRIRYLFFIIAVTGSLFVAKQSYLHDGVHPHEEHITNYGHVIQVGSVIAALSSPQDTLFLDGYDDIIYWQANRVSAYRYSWYTSMMPTIPLYKKERDRMFVTTPPDFYYGSCSKPINSYYEMPDAVRPLYVRLLEDGRPSCVWVKKTKFSSITDTQWEAAKAFLYTYTKPQ